MREHTKNMTNRLNYLIGTPGMFIRNYDQLQDWCPEARQIRCLCALRSKILAQYRQLQEAFLPCMSLAEHPGLASDWQDLEEVGIEAFQEDSLHAYVLRLSMMINERLDSIAGAFSDIPLEWLKELFALPQKDMDGVQAAARSYGQFRNLYPFQMYINWHFKETAPQSRSKYIFRDDATLMAALIDAHECNRFALRDFVMERDEVTVICNCENTDADKLYIALRDLGPWISDVILISSQNVSGLWKVLAAELEKAGFHVHWDMISRFKEEKSPVGVRLAARACEEHYANGAQSLVLATSNSDIWALFSSLPNADIFVLAERCCVSAAFSGVLTQCKIPHGYMEDIAGDSTCLADRVMRKELDEAIRQISMQQMAPFAGPMITRLVASVTKKNNFFFTCEQFERYVAEYTERCRQELAPAEEELALRTAV